MSWDGLEGFPAGCFQTIVVDPPWRYDKRTKLGLRRRHGRPSAEDHYETLDNATILGLPVGELAAENAHLYLWVTNPRIYGERDDDSITPHDMIKAWGFKYKTMLTWVKTQFGLGSYYRGQTEHVLFATRGHLPVAPSQRLPNVFTAPRRQHSAKPDAFYELVERVSPGPRIDLFARRYRDGWEAWGNELP